jgi:hypothetical protein
MNAIHHHRPGASPRASQVVWRAEGDALARRMVNTCPGSSQSLFTWQSLSAVLNQILGKRRACESLSTRARAPASDAHCHRMSIADAVEAARPRSPKRKRSDSDATPPQYDGAADDNGAAALQYSYEDEMPSELQSPAAEQEEQDGAVPAKKPRLERPRRLNYVPYMTLRGHKRGVAAVKYSPDGRWIASCCMAHPVNFEVSVLMDMQPPTRQSKSGTPPPVPSPTPSKATWPASPPSPGRPTRSSWLPARMTRSSASGTSRRGSACLPH